MSRFTHGLCISAFLCLAACSKNSNTENNSSGVPAVCSQSTLDLYNAINLYGRSYDNAASTAHLMLVKKACSDFASSMGGNSCVVADGVTGQQLTINANSNRDCQKVDQLLGQNRGSFRAGLTLIVLKDETFNQMARDGYFGLKGQNCSLKMDQNYQAHDRDVIRINKISTSSRNAKQKITISGQNLVIACTKMDTNPWTVENLQSAFGATAYIFANR